MHKLVASYKILLILFFFGWTHTLVAQRNLYKGERLFDLNLFEEAIPYFEKELENNNREIEYAATEYLADCYRYLGDFEQAENFYLKLFKMKKREPIHVLNYALALKASSKYAEAAEQFQIYQEMNPEDPMAEFYIESCYLAQSWLDETLGKDAKNMFTWNSPNMELSPVILGPTVYYSAIRKNNKKRLVTFNDSQREIALDFYSVNYTTSADGRTEAQPVDGLNTPFHEGPATFSADGTEVYFTRTVQGKKDKKAIKAKAKELELQAQKGSKRSKKRKTLPTRQENIILSTLNIYYSKKDSTGKWSKPVSAFDFNSKTYSCGHPSLSADGNFLFFMSDMPGGLGGTDIWYVQKSDSGTWGKPINCGTPLNTFGYELFPTIHQQTGKLYFSSNVHPGMGKLDLFSADWVDDKFKRVTNLKPPFNSIGDDFGITLTDNGTQGFFTSDRFNGYGSDDIYAFSLESDLTLTVDGNKFSFENNIVFNDVTYSLYNKSTETYTDIPLIDGIYQFEVDTSLEYTLVARKNGFPYNKVDIDFALNNRNELMHVILTPSLHDVYVNGYLSESKLSPRFDSTLLDVVFDTLVTRAPGAYVSLLTEDDLLERKLTNRKGYFEFSKTVQAGTNNHLIAYKEPRVELEETIALKGILRSGDEPLKNALVLLKNGDEVVGQTTTNYKGEYVFDAEYDKNYTVEFQKQGYSSNSLQISTADDNLEDFLIAEEITIDPKDPIPFSGLVAIDDMPLKDVWITVYDGTKVIKHIKTNEDGSFNLNLLDKGDYEITATAEGFFQKEQRIKLEDFEEGVPLNLNFEMKQLVKGEAIELPDVYYDFNKTEIMYESLPTMFKLLEFLKINEDVRIELSAHTDARGSAAYNEKLSQGRAESVYYYLVIEGIEPYRLKAVGYGETKLRNRCADGIECTEEEHQYNRRTEVTILPD